jgi:hypothetical protein
MRTIVVRFVSVALFVSSALAFAGAIPPVEITTVPFTANGDTTGGTNAIDVVPDFCSVRTTVAGPEAVYTFTPQAGASLTITVTPLNADYDPAVYVTFAPDAADACLWGADANGPGAAETFQISDRLTPGTTHYLYVDSFFDAATNPSNASGPFRIDVTGTLPVELIGFDVR